MVTKCANPSCAAVVRYLRGGRLFLVEMSAIVPMSTLSSPEAEFRQSGPRTEYFWLCEQCAKSMTITSDGNGHALISVHMPSQLKRECG